MQEQAPWIAALVAPFVSGFGAWFVRGRQRKIETEGGALELYRDALTVLENAQRALGSMAEAQETMRAQLQTCVRAREDGALERAKDRVKIAQLEQGRVEDGQKIARLEATVATLTKGQVPNV